MGIGFVMQKKFELNLQTLARLNIYFLVPGFIFVKLHSTQISANLFGNILLFFILYVVLSLFCISHFVGKSDWFGKRRKDDFFKQCHVF